MLGRDPAAPAAAQWIAAAGPGIDHPNERVCGYSLQGDQTDVFFAVAATTDPSMSDEDWLRKFRTGCREPRRFEVLSGVGDLATFCTGKSSMPDEPGGELESVVSGIYMDLYVLGRPDASAREACIQLAKAALN